uniref:Serpentine Receptor, class T n=1 Tax=Rhabditophanes sp. KR3021 TaxID=114890 RepID=A0AC35U8J9_9BILA
MLFYWDSATFESHYNCSQRSYEEWEKEANPNVPLGLFYIVLSVTFQILYVPSIMTLGSKAFIKQSAYKIMFVLGIVDFTVLCFLGCLDGYLTIIGSIHCLNPRLTYISGIISSALWVASCPITSLLAFSRAIDLLNSKLYRMLFHGNKTWYWMLIPLLYTLYFTLFTNPVLFSSKIYAQANNPYVAIKGVWTNWSYVNTFLMINDVGIGLFLGIIYIICSYIIYRKFKKSSSKTVFTNAQASLIYQTSIITVAALITSLLFVYFNLFDASVIASIVGEVFWIVHHGAAAPAYLFLNKTLRKHILAHYVPNRFQKAIVSSTVVGTIQIKVKQRAVIIR